MKYSLENQEKQNIMLLTTEECMEQCRELAGFASLRRNIQDHNIEYCKVEMHESCIIGTLLIPDKENPNDDLFSFSFYMDAEQLLFVDDASHIKEVDTMIREGELLQATDIAQFFSKMLAYLIGDDMSCLQSYEEKLSFMEERMMEDFSRDIHREIQACRRELLILNSYFFQMMDICDTLEDNLPNYYGEDTVTRAYANLSNRINRLYGHTQMLREYALQVREMYQSQVDIRQNDTMRILTVVTAIFLPLSLVTGWYGMNFVHMPELQKPYAYGVVVIICIIMVIAEIIFFKFKDWL